MIASVFAPNPTKLLPKQVDKSCNRRRRFTGRTDANKVKWRRFWLDWDNRWAGEVREEFPNRLIQNYLEPDGRLRQIPATRKKRHTVLAWLATHFDYDRRYREPEVNQILQTRHWDSATLRRELVGYRMLARERGVYWRLPEEHVFVQ
jgi:hypothetical protein